MPHHLTSLEFGAAAAGVSARTPQLIVHQATLALRQLLDAGTAQEDPRCLALLQLINSARSELIPHCNNGAKLARDLASKAVHIDISTASLAALMSLDAATLTPVASVEASRGLAKPTAPSTHDNRPILKLLPRPAQRATDALFALIKADNVLGTRAHNEAQFKSSSMATKLHKLRAGQRHANLRKRRLASEGGMDSSAELPEILPPFPTPSPRFQPTPPPLYQAPMPPRFQAPPPPRFQPAPAAAAPPRFHPPPQFQTPPQIHTSLNHLGHVEGPGSSGLQQYAVLGQGNMVYSSPVKLPVQHISPPSRPLGVIQLDACSAQDGNSGDRNVDGQPVSSFSRFRSRQTYTHHAFVSQPHMETPEVYEPVALQQDRPAVSHVLATDKGVMNDVIGTPTDIMDAFMHPQERSYAAATENVDNPTKVRSVLAERERILFRLVRRRQSELAAMPLGMTEQTRRKAIIEAKQLSLLDLQRVVRYRVCAEMKKMHSLSIQEDGAVPPDHLSKMFRRRDPPIYSYTDGYPRITPFDGVAEMKPRPPAVVAQDSKRMAQFDMSRMLNQKAQRQREFSANLVRHYEKFQQFAHHVRSSRARIGKGFERYFLEKKRIEEKKRKMERVERLRLLRSNDEQAYLNLLKETKNERLLQLVRQTDSYLMRIGASVEKSREQVTLAAGEDAHNAFADELGERDQVSIDAMRRRRDLYYTVTHSVLEEVRQPSMMVHGTLKPYQVEGLKWMVSLYNNNLNGILADEMGLGKTIQTIALITYLVQHKKNPGPYLIIVPLSTMGNWVRELDLWAPTLVKVAYRGDKSTRRAIQQKEMAGSEYNVLLTTYEFTVKDQHVLGRVPWQYIIIDEGHRMKNANCKLAMTLGVKYRSRNRLLLTGTPLQNNLTELWALLNFLLPTIFSSADTFETWFKQPFESTTLGDTAELEEEETLLVINRLHQVLRPFLLRRLKTDVESQLPEKVEHVIRCDMSTWQRVLYRQVQNRVGLATGSHNGSVKAYNNLLMQCKKICNHPYLFYDAEAILDLPQDYLIRASGKFFLLHHMLPKLKLHGHRTLIFSQMTAALDYLEDFLIAIGMKYMRLDGNTKADDRQELLNQFNAKDSPYFCFLLSTRAGGLGLNLQTADTVIIFDSDWNPMMDLQAQDRAHRIGQTNVVRVYRLICSGTVEVKILDQANRKLQVDAQIIQAGQFNNKSTEVDRHQMLRNIIRQKSDDGDELGVVPDMEELNRLFARSDEEFETFCKYDEDIRSSDSFKSLFEKETELPEWVLQPDVDHKTAEEKEKEILTSHGRGRRRRKPAHRDMDALTDAEWLKVMEGDMTIEEALEKRKRRSSAILERKAAAEDRESRDDGANTQHGPGSEGISHEDGRKDLNGDADDLDDGPVESNEEYESLADSELGVDSSVTDHPSEPVHENEHLKSGVTRKSSRMKTPSAVQKAASDALKPDCRAPKNGVANGEMWNGKGSTKPKNGKVKPQNAKSDLKISGQTVPPVRIRLSVGADGENDQELRVVEEPSIEANALERSDALNSKRKSSNSSSRESPEKRQRGSLHPAEGNASRENSASDTAGDNNSGAGDRLRGNGPSTFSRMSFLRKRKRLPSTRYSDGISNNAYARNSARKRQKGWTRKHEGADLRESAEPEEAFVENDEVESSRADELGSDSDEHQERVALKLRIKKQGEQNDRRPAT